MFWRSIGAGLALFAHWQVWVVCLGAALSMWLVIILFGLFMSRGGKEHEGLRLGVGCLTYSIVQPASILIVVTISTLALLPIILGGDGLLPWSGMRGLFWTGMLWGLGGAVLYFLLIMIPILGSMIDAGPPVLSTFLISIAIVKGTMREMMSALGATGMLGSISPGFWAQVGYVLLGIMLFFVSILLTSAFQVSLSTRPRQRGLDGTEDKEPGFLAYVLTSTLLVAAGLAPVFMYGQFVVLSAKALVH
jgi:hypothetical protein